MLEKLNMNSIITRCDDLVREKEFALGVIMIVAGILVMFGLAKFTGLGLMVYGLAQVFWGKEKIVQTIEEHHHHHHHNKPKHKKAPRKNNG
jgi:uncharacterized membrane protein HdeD (DUF308 family)